jgi:hypothetical protein
MAQDHWLPGFNFNVEAWFEGAHCETLAICRSLEPARAALIPRRLGLQTTKRLTLSFRPLEAMGQEPDGAARHTQAAVDWR